MVNKKLTQEVNKQKHADLNIEPIVLFGKEKNELQRLPESSIIEQYLNRYKKIKVTSESLIRFRGKAYSVDPQYINCYVNVELQENKILIYYQEKLIETYDIEKYSQKINYKHEHYVNALAKSFGKNTKVEDIENKAKENLKNFDILGGLVNELQ